MSPNDTKKLTARQKKAIEALLSGYKVKDAALAVGVSDRTLARWRDDKAFASELQRRSGQAVKDAATRMTGNMDAMLDVLLEVANDDMAPRHVRVRAATSWIDRQGRLVELAEVLERLDALEQKAGRW